MSESIARTEPSHPTASWNTSVPNPHDAFFKAIMTDIRMAKTFLSIYLPERFKSKCDFSTLALQSSSFVEENLRQHFSDVLYSIQMEGLTSYVYCLLEHVSHPKRTTAFQVLRYQVAAMHQS
jgi:predicted transposase/invertase (TIGR01784 family)